MQKPEYYCRVCGYQYETPTWEDEETPSHDICVCCGVQFGYEDTNIDGVRQYRNQWIASGAKWVSPHFRFRIMDWNLELQLNQIPENWR